MAQVLVTYYTRSGNTEKMAKEIVFGFKAEGIHPDLRKIAEIGVDDLLQYDGIIIGSPTYYGGMAAEVKKLLDDSVKFHGKLEGKVGGAFTSSHNIGGGNETTILDINNALLIHGMIVQGDSQGDHYGPVAILSPDERAVKMCRRFGKRAAQLIKKLFK